MSNRGVYSGNLVNPADAFSGGLGDNEIVSTLCPGGKEQRLMAMIGPGRVELSEMIAHRYSLGRLERACELFTSQTDGVLKTAITP